MILQYSIYPASTPIPDSPLSIKNYSDIPFYEDDVNFMGAPNNFPVDISRLSELQTFIGREEKLTFLSERLN